MDSDGGIFEVVLGTAFSYYDRRTGDNKNIGLKLMQAVRTESRSKRQFGSTQLTVRAIQRLFRKCSNQNTKHFFKVRLLTL